MNASAGKRRGKCHNYSGCLLAYRGELTEVGDGQPFVCSECGKPLTEVKASAKGMMMLIVGLVVLIIVGVGAMIVWPKIKPLFEKKVDSAEAEATPSVKPPVAKKDPPTQPGVATPKPGPQPSNNPPVQDGGGVVKAPPKIDLNVSSAENRKTKDEVLSRVDSMPVTQANKDKLYSSVERARQMGKVFTIPFASGKIAVAAADIAAIKAELEKPELMKWRDDPTAVFVILGFADPKGDPKKNIQISQQRADSVMEAMRDKCGVFNVLHSVAMGGSTLVDAENLDKNRIVEVWVVLP